MCNITRQAFGRKARYKKSEKSQDHTHVTVPNGKTLRRNRKQLRERVVHNDHTNNIQNRSEEVNENASAEKPDFQETSAYNMTTEMQDNVSSGTQLLATRSGRIVKKPERYCDELVYMNLILNSELIDNTLTTSIKLID